MLHTIRRIMLALSIALPALLLPMVAHADGGAPNVAYVAGTAGGISIIDISQQKVTRTIAVNGSPHTVFLSLDGSFLYVTEPQQGCLLCWLLIQEMRSAMQAFLGSRAC